MKQQTYAFITGALVSLTVTLYALIWMTATGDGGAWDSGLSIALTASIIALIGTVAARDYIKEDARQADRH